MQETIQILRGLKKVYEEHHGVIFTARALRAAAELSAKHINDRQLPDKAIDVLDEAGAADRMRAAGEAAPPRSARATWSGWWRASPRSRSGPSRPTTRRRCTSWSRS